MAKTLFNINIDCPSGSGIENIPNTYLATSIRDKDQRVLAIV